MKKALVYLADLTHVGPVLSSNVFPLSVGLVAANLMKHRSDSAEVQLFKYPSDFSLALESRTPAIVGFANYSWNFHLSYQYARIIKALWPQIVVVFGGPNYGLDPEEIAAFWQDFPLIDFYVVGEGETSFLNLFDMLQTSGLSVAQLKQSGARPANCHFLHGDEIKQGPMLPRVNLGEIPSPYLLGLMDKFFDGKLSPMIHTTRGCPFSCTFCTEGDAYFNTVSHSMEYLREELAYIARRAKGLRDLYITDANFGMYGQDLEKAQAIADCQKEFEFPRQIHVSTGKNKKDRVIEIARRLNGALNLTASLQSTDELVLKNVSRSNISVNKLADIGLEATRSDTGTYSEIILGLPGDSLQAHRQSLRDVVDANFDNIRIYQLIMLPQTVLNSPVSRRAHGMKTMHRVMPRSFGCYRVAGQEILAVESEEILIENATLPFADYLDCRELDLTVEIVHNGKVYQELHGLCLKEGLSWFDFILRFYNGRRRYNWELCSLYEDFRESHCSRLWKTRDDLEACILPSLKNLLRDEKGTNEMSAGKATAFFEQFEAINNILFDEMESWLRERDRLNPITIEYLKQSRRLSFLRKSRIADVEAAFEDEFTFDFVRMENSQFTMHPSEVRLTRPKALVVRHSLAQKERISEVLSEFGQSKDGLGKMLMRHPQIHRLFRHTIAPQ